MGIHNARCSVCPSLCSDTGSARVATPILLEKHKSPFGENIFSPTPLAVKQERCTAHAARGGRPPAMRKSALHVRLSQENPKKDQKTRGINVAPPGFALTCNNLECAYKLCNQSEASDRAAAAATKTFWQLNSAYVHNN